MKQNFKLPEGLDKEEKYKRFIPAFEALIKDVGDETGMLANASAALHDAFGFFWVGFYRVEGENLLLGPFQGSVACYSIGKGRGVCGTAWRESRTVMVPDVTEFPGHIACSSESRSEIVVPVFSGKSPGKVRYVLDIDSDKYDAFDETDRIYLEKITALISNNI